MAELLNFFVLVRYGSAAQASRLLYYLNPETRPDFPEEVPAAEASWVEPFEFLLDPNSLDRKDENTVIAGFGDDSDLGDEPKRIVEAITCTSPDLIVSWSERGDDTWVERWDNGQPVRLWCSSPPEQEGIESPRLRLLDKASDKRLHDMGADAAKMLRVVAEALRT